MIKRLLIKILLRLFSNSGEDILIITRKSNSTGKMSCDCATEDSCLESTTEDDFLYKFVQDTYFTIVDAIANRTAETDIKVTPINKRKVESWMGLTIAEIDNLDEDNWEHYKNGGCLCDAYSKGDCVCGAWWRII